MKTVEVFGDVGGLSKPIQKLEGVSSVSVDRDTLMLTVAGTRGSAEFLQHAWSYYTLKDDQNGEGTD